MRLFFQPKINGESNESGSRVCGNQVVATYISQPQLKKLRGLASQMKTPELGGLTGRAFPVSKKQLVSDPSSNCSGNI